ncbi:hypothetical protein [Sphingomonas sp. MMS24-J13]|uniref:hypothetical protein n=1 Tax=Sphingomonas sp. MMS24-J13 TaxID=3238686 RepID=UPI0038514A30
MLMTLAAAALAALQTEAAPAPPSADEIVVMGERMRRLRLVTRTDKKTGAQSCVIKRHSGDPAFDGLMCETTLACAKTVTTRPQMEACISPSVQAYARKLAAGQRPANSSTDP